MTQLSTYGTPANPYLLDQRDDHHFEEISLLVVTEKGTGQVVDIHREGFSFGCLYPHDFPNEFYVDILDANGSHIKKIRVRKMWETIGDYQEPSSMFELVVGVEFCELSAPQLSELDYLLEDNSEQLEFPYFYTL